jgi:hypothetical protein
VDEIPSLELVIPTLVEEQESEEMNVDSSMEEKNPTTKSLGMGALQ